jgi:hypothetical protein
VKQTDISATAQNDTRNFAPLFGGGEIKMSSTPKAVTPFAGLASFFSWLGTIGYRARVAEVMPFGYKSPNAIPLDHTLRAFLSSVIVGASRFAHAGWLRHDKALHAMLGIPRFPGEDAIRRFFHQFSQARIEAFWRPLWIWLLGLMAAPAEGFTLDMDSTIFNREGRQQGAAKGYNPRRPGRKSHHPLLAVLAEAPFVLHAWLRSGNTSAGRGVVAFLSEALALLPIHWKLRCVRADSGFFDKALLSFLETRAIPYIVVARMTQEIKRRLHAIPHWQELEGGAYAVASFQAKLSGWDPYRRFVVVRERVREEKAAVGRKLLDVPGYTFRVWVTNRPEDALEIWRDYNPRATVEQRIEEIKNDLNADGFCTQAFFATEAAFLAVLFAYNLLALYQGQVTASCGYRKPSTLRTALFVGGAILGRCGRKTLLRFSQAWGGLHKHNLLIDASLHTPKTIAPLLPRSPDLGQNYELWASEACAI